MTARGRASILCFDLPFGRMLPIPSGTVDQAARQILTHKYADLLAGGHTTGVGFPYIPTVRRRRR